MSYSMPQAAANTRLAPILDSVNERLQQRMRRRDLVELRRQTAPDPLRRKRFIDALLPGAAVWTAEV